MNPLETYLRAGREVRAAGAVPETSYYPALSELLNEAGKTLSLRSYPLIATTGAKIPNPIAAGRKAGSLNRPNG